MPSQCTRHPRIPVCVLRNDRESHGTETDRAREGHADDGGFCPLFHSLSICPEVSLREDTEVASAVSGIAFLTTWDVVLALKDILFLQRGSKHKRATSFGVNRTVVSCSAERTGSADHIEGWCVVFHLVPLRQKAVQGDFDTHDLPCECRLYGPAPLHQLF